MDRLRDPKVWLIAGAVLAGVVVLAVVAVLGPDLPHPGSSDPTPIASQDVPDAVDPSRVRPGDPLTGDRNPNATRGERGQLITEADADKNLPAAHISWDTIHPRPDGVSDIEGPAATLYFEPHRILRITARTARIDAPEQQLRQARFEGDVVLTLYETTPGTAIDPSTDRQVTLRAFLDDAQVDPMLGRVDTAGPVHVTGPRFDFTGTGLTLVYNQLRGRLQRLEVASGRRLRFAREEAETQGMDEPAPRGREREGRPDRAAKPQAVGVGEAGPGGEPLSPHQYYQARFEREVEVALGDEAALSGASLEVWFAMATDPPEARSAKGVTGLGGVRGVRGARGGRLNSVAMLVSLALAVEVETENADAARSLMARRADDVVVDWSGPLVVTPVTKPEVLAGPEDAMLALRGGKGDMQEVRARAVTSAGETVRAGELTYLASSGRVRCVGGVDGGEAEGEGGGEVRVTSGELGELTAASLVLEPRAGRGVVVGPGRLVTRAEEGDAAADEGPLTVTWGEKLNLRFAEGAEGAGAGGGAGGGGGESAGGGERMEGSLGRLGPLTSATFTGGAKAEHPRFALAGGTLDIAFVATGETSQPARITATAADSASRATMTAVGDDPADTLDVAAGELVIELEPTGEGEEGGEGGDEGRPQPRRMLARGGVEARRPGMVLTSASLDVALAEPAASGDSRDPEPGVETLTAVGDVRVALDDPPTRLAAARLVADPAAETIELIGDATHPAVVIREGSTLTGSHLVLDREAQTLTADGSGTFMTPLRSDDGEPGRLDLTWREAMRFDNARGVATFRGGVDSRTAAGLDRSHLTAGAVELTFEPTPLDDTAASSRAVDTPTPSESSKGANGASSTTNRAETRADTLGRLRRLIALGDAVLEAKTLSPDRPDDPDRPLSSVRLEGRQITFEQQDEGEDRVQRVLVPGEGRMFIEDYRSPGSTDESKAVAPSFTGRGATLLLWTGGLTLDAAGGTMTARDEVQLIHRPLEEEAEASERDGENQPLRLTCGRLDAVLDHSGNLGVLDREPGATPDIQRIEAHGEVRIAHADRRVATDHLRYLAADRLVQLWADDGRRVEVSGGKLPPLSAQAALWQLDQDRFTATRVGGGAAGIEKR